MGKEIQPKDPAAKAKNTDQKRTVERKDQAYRSGRRKTGRKTAAYRSGR